MFVIFSRPLPCAEPHLLPRVVPPAPRGRLGEFLQRHPPVPEREAAAVACFRARARAKVRETPPSINAGNANFSKIFWRPLPRNPPSYRSKALNLQPDVRYLGAFPLRMPPSTHLREKQLGAKQASSIAFRSAVSLSLPS